MTNELFKSGHISEIFFDAFSWQPYLLIKMFVVSSKRISLNNYLMLQSLILQLAIKKNHPAIKNSRVILLPHKSMSSMCCSMQISLPFNCIMGIPQLSFLIYNNLPDFCGHFNIRFKCFVICFLCSIFTEFAKL